MSLNNKKKRNNNILVLSLTFAFMFMIVLIPLLNKGTHSTDVTEESTDTLTLTCPDVALGNEEVECNISLNSTSIVTQGLTIKYNLPEGVEYVEFTTDSFEVYSNDENGVVLVNLDGISDNASVGSLKLKMPTNAVSNSIYKIELVDSTIGDGEDTVIELDDVYDEIRIKSDINTLDSIALSSGVLNETFDKDTLEYTVTTDVDKITISAVKTDEYSTISGDVDVEKELHYGTNEFNIVVTSESGIEKTYKVSVFRTYKFTTDKYVYNEEDNYIYVATDIDNLLNNISVDNSLDKEIENNNLVISYENEKILVIKIVGINFNKYELVNDILYVDKEMTAEEFGNNVEYSEGISFELSEDGRVKVLYNGIELDSYDIVVYNLEFACDMTIDEDNSYIKYLDLGMSVNEFLDMVTLVGGTAQVVNKTGNVKDQDDLIATGDVFRVYLGDAVMDEYTLSVLGDSSGDGRMSTIDLAQFRKHLVNWVNPNTGVEFELEGVYEEAFDLNKDGRISVVDLAIMRKKIVGLI